MGAVLSTYEEALQATFLKRMEGVTWADVKEMVRAGGYLRRSSASPKLPSPVLDAGDVRIFAQVEINRLNDELQVVGVLVEGRVKDLQADLVNAARVADELRAELEAAREQGAEVLDTLLALRPYARCLPLCHSNAGHESHPCNCGFEALRTP